MDGAALVLLEGEATATPMRSARGSLCSRDKLAPRHPGIYAGRCR